MNEYECEPLPANVSEVEAKFLSEVVRRMMSSMLIDTEKIF